MRNLIWGVFGFFLINQGAAGAAVTNKLLKIETSNEQGMVRVEMTFRKPVQAHKLHPVLDRNFVQITLVGTAMDAARIQPAAKPIEKVFAYPYSADTSRVRLIGSAGSHWNAAWLSSNIKLTNTSPRTVLVTVGSPPASLPTAKEKAAEQEALKDVLANTKEIDLRNPDAIKPAIIQPKEKELSKEQIAESQPIEAGPVGVKSEPSRGFAKMALSLLAVLAIFGATVAGIKRFGGSKKLPFGKKERIIQVIATHYLGAKKNISLVKVAGEYMVVGTSNEGVSLISKLGPEINVDKYLEDRFWGGTFENHLKAYSKDVLVSKPEATEVAIPAKTIEIPEAPKPVTAAVSVRAGIREKLAQLKPLS